VRRTRHGCTRGVLANARARLVTATPTSASLRILESVGMTCTGMDAS